MGIEKGDKTTALEIHLCHFLLISQLWVVSIDCPLRKMKGFASLQLLFPTCLPHDNSTAFAGDEGRGELCPPIPLAVLPTVTLMAAPWSTPVLYWMTQSLAALEACVSQGSCQENRTHAR